MPNQEISKAEKEEQPEIQDNAAQEKPVKKKTADKRSSGSGIIFFLLILITAAGVAATYYFWQLQQQQAKTLSQQQQMLSSLKQQIVQTKADIKTATSFGTEHAQQLQNLNQQIKQTEAISQQAIETVNRSQRGWVLAEVDYLLRIAHQRIAVAKDIAGAIAALKGADEQLEQLGDLNLFNIRKQLAKDIASLNAIHQADVNGITLALDQIISNLPDLPFKSAEEEIKIQFSGNNAVEEPKIEDKTFIDSILETVKEIGDIKVHQRSIKAASNAQQQNQIEQLLRTYLLGARLAALRFDQTQFLHEINQASELVRLHYDEKDNRIEQLQKMLLKYSALQLSPDLPELTKAWTMLQKEIKNPSRLEDKSSKQEAAK